MTFITYHNKDILIDLLSQTFGTIAGFNCRARASATVNGAVYQRSTYLPIPQEPAAALRLRQGATQFSPVRSVNVPSPNIYAMFTSLIKIHYIIKSLNFKMFLHFISAAVTQRLPIEREKRVINFRSSDLHYLLSCLIYLSVQHCVSVSLCMSTALTDVLCSSVPYF